MQPVISIRDLTKTYAGGFEALKSVDLDIDKGEIFGLLGPNGAGKTTMINIVCGIVMKTSGTVTVEAALPALFTTQRGLNEPRYASLPGIMKAKKKPVDVKTVADLGVDAAQVGAANRKVKIKSMSLPPERQAVRMVEGEAAADKAAALVKILHDETKII